MKKMIKYLRIGLMVFMLSFTVMSAFGYAYAADEGPQTGTELKKDTTPSGDIFTILQKKLYDTLKDLRKIVYVVSGFGLVMFSVAAIFNKISYKHLGYIMIGLSLLALMFPFLEYFSGVSVEEVEQKQLAFKNYLAASDYSRIRGELDSDVLDGTGEGQEALTPEEIAELRRKNEENALQPIDSSQLAGGVTGGETGLIGENPIQKKVEQAKAIMDAGCSPTTMKGEWSENGTRTVCSIGSDGNIRTSTETCSGQMKDGTCQKTAGQVFNDIWKTGQQAIQVGLGAAHAWNSGKSTISNVVNGLDRLGEIANSDMGDIDKMYYGANSASNTARYVAQDLASIIGGLMNAANSAGNISTTWSSDPENNAAGENPFTALMAALGGYGQTAQNAVVKGAGNVNTVTDYGVDVHTQANNINVILTLFGLR